MVVKGACALCDSQVLIYVASVAGLTVRMYVVGVSVSSAV